MIGSCRRDLRLAMEFGWPFGVVTDGLPAPNCGLAPAGSSGGKS